MINFLENYKFSIGSQEINDFDWRTRAIISISGRFNDEVFPFINSGIRIIPLKISGLNSTYIIEVYINKDSYTKIEDAHFVGIQRIQEFTDQISIISYDKVEIHRYLSTCPVKVKKGVEFEMLIPDNYKSEKWSQSIDKKDIIIGEQLWDNSKYVAALRQFREGLCSPFIESKFLHYFASLERIAENETTEDLKSICKKCGNSEVIGKATSKFIKSELINYGIDNSMYNKIRKARGKIAHGAGERTVKYMNYLMTLLPALESATLEIITKYTGIQHKSSFFAHTFNQSWLLTGIKRTNRFLFIPPIFNIINFKYSGNFIISGAKNNINKQYEKGGFLTPELASSKRFNIHREAWPY